jgi:hypothetical protein
MRLSSQNNVTDLRRFFDSRSAENEASKLWASVKELWACTLDLFPTVALATLGALGLFFLYRRVDQDWPESYHSVQSVASAQVRRGFFQHYLVFRGGPVFLVAAFVGVTAERLNGNAWIAVILTAILHLGSTNVLALVRVVRDSSRPQRVALAAHHLGVILTSTLAAVAAVFFRPQLAGLIPDPDDVMIAVWAGVFATVFGTAVRWLMQPPAGAPSSVIDDLRKDVGESHWQHIGVVAIENNCDERVLKAVILAEVQQRPRWVRKIERIKGLVVKGGTYGVAQVTADQPISDKESIEILGARFQDYWPAMDGDGVYDALGLQQRLLQHNPDVDHANRVLAFYDELLYV